jgi:hypothetical protein
VADSLSKQTLVFLCRSGRGGEGDERGNPQ